jgi:hypothetical protein
MIYANSNLRQDYAAIKHITWNFRAASMFIGSSHYLLQGTPATSKDKGNNRRNIVSKLPEYYIKNWNKKLLYYKYAKLLY